MSSILLAIASGKLLQVWKDKAFPTGRPKWNREAIDKLLSNEKYTGRVLLQKTVSTGVAQIENDGIMERYLYAGSHVAIISAALFIAVQQAKLNRSKEPQNQVVMKLTL